MEPRLPRIRDGTADYDFLTSTGINTESGISTAWTVKYEKEIEDKNSIKNTIKVNAGAFGFKTEMEGSVKSTSSVSTTIGSSLEVLYELPDPGDPTPRPDDWPLYLSQIGIDAYLLNAKTDNAFFIPDSCRSPKGVNSTPGA